MGGSIVSGNIQYGGWIGYLSTGELVAAFVSGTNTLYVVTDLEGSPSSVTASSTALSGTGAGALFIGAELDDSDELHVIFASDGGTRKIGHVAVTNLTGTPSIGTPDTILASWSENPNSSFFYVDCGVTDTGVVFAVFTDYMKDKGTVYAQGYYASSADWSTHTRVTVTDALNYYDFSLAVSTTDDFLFTYTSSGSGGYLRRSHTNLGFSSETTYQAGNVQASPQSVYDDSYNTLEFAVSNSYYITESGTALDGAADGIYAHNPGVNPSYVMYYMRGSSDKYAIFVANASHSNYPRDIVVFSNTGSGWVDEGALVAGTWTYARGGNQVWNLNAEDEQKLPVLYQAGSSTTVYWETFSTFSGVNYVRIIDEEERLVETRLNILGALKLVAETINVSESVLSFRGLVRLIAETTEIDETVLKFLTIYRTISETIESSEAVLRFRAIYRAASETIQVDEAAVNIFSLLRVIDETLNISETTLKFAGYIKAISETAQISESVLSFRSLVRLIAETVQTSEAVLQFRTLVRTISESETVAETIFQLRGRLKAINETINVPETIVDIVSRSLLRVIDEVNQISETALNLAGFVRIVSETAEISEVALSIRNLIRLIADTVSINDSALYIRSLVRTIAETINTSETVLSFRSLTRLVAETVNVSETTVKIKGILQNISEAVNIPETAQQVAGFVRIISESVNIQETIVDILTGAVALVKVIDETISISETVGQVSGFVRLVSESISNNESINRVIGFIKVISEDTNISEAVLSSRALYRLQSETSQVVEIVVRNRTLARLISETIQEIETVLSFRGLNRIVSETENVAESVLNSLGLVRIVNEVIDVQETIFHLVAEFLASVSKQKFKSMARGVFKRIQ